MPHRVAINPPRLRLPPRPTLAISSGPTSIEAETADHQKDMSAADVYRNPIALPLLSIVEKSIGSHLPLEKSGFTKNVARRSAAIVTPVVELGMPAAILVGLIDETIGRRHRALYFPGRKEGCTCLAIAFQVHRSHELLLMLHYPRCPNLRATATHERETCEKKKCDPNHS